MSRSRYPTATEREAAKRAGDVDPPHPADRFDDPLSAKLADQPEEAMAKRPQLRHVGGSQSDQFNIDIVNACVAASWITAPEDHTRLVQNIGKALAGIAPQDELEAMVASQMVAANAASMECFRRAMLRDQSLEGRAMNLSQANKAARTFAQLLEALDRHRGKGGEQRVVVEHVHRHVHVHSDHPTALDATPGGGDQQKTEGQSHAPMLDHQPTIIAPMWSEDAEREPVPRAGDAEREMPDARRHKPRRAQR